MYRLIILCMLAGMTVLPVRAETSPTEDEWTFNFGPLISRQRDIHGHMRLRILGPLFERAKSDEGQSLTAIRPLYSRFEDPASERSRQELLWPVGFSKHFRDDNHGRFLLAFWTNFDTTDPQSRYRFWLLPFYFQGRDIHGDRYAAVFPIGGRVHEILGQDRITFALFPLFMRTELNQIVTHDYVWPIVSHTEGKGIYRFRVFPFYGQSRHRDRFNKKFVMWPFWTSAEYYYPHSSGSGWILFPFYGQMRLTDQRSWTVLPPFFRVTRGTRQNLALLPWPFIQRRTGEINQTYVWPIAGQKRTRGLETRFYAWPIVREERIDRRDYLVKRRYVFPIYYSDVREAHEPAAPLALDEPVPRGERVTNYQKVWPLISYRREGESSRLRMLDLWPLKESHPIERNYAPFWTLYQVTRLEEATETELLWGMYRGRSDGDEYRSRSLFPVVEWERDDRDDESLRRWSLLKGLIGYKRTDTTRRFQLLYLLRWTQDQENDQ